MAIEAVEAPTDLEPTESAELAVQPKGKLYEVTPDGTLNFFFHPGQLRAWNSESRFTWMLAGTQGGKTSFSPLWLWRECMNRGPGDYIAATSTFPLLKMKLLPEYMRFFRDTLHLGEWHAMDRVFVFNGERAAMVFGDGHWRDEPARIIFGSGINPEGLESATAKAAALDECVAPETLIETEWGPLPIGVIVKHRLDVRVWSMDTETGAWSWRRITRWQRRAQTRPLRRVGRLRLTGNHRLWTRHAGYTAADAVLTHPAWYSVLHARPFTNSLLRAGVVREAAHAARAETLLQPGVRADGVAGDAPGAAAHGLRGGTAGHLGGAEAALRRSGESAVGADGWRENQSSGLGAGGAFRAHPAGPPVGEGRERPTALLASGVGGGAHGVGERVRGNDQRRLVAPGVQDRRGAAGVEDRGGDWQRGVSPETGVVRAQWVDVSALLESHGRDVAGRSAGEDSPDSSDGHVYNLTVEKNHNYVANGLLVANCGQDDFRLQSYEAILRRLSIHQGRVLGGTTIYNLGWIKSQAYDPWKRGDPEHSVIQFASTQNPMFPAAEMERARRTLPKWKFDMFYRGIITRPGGLIYDDFVDEYAPAGHVVPAFRIPREWPCSIGVDFGAVNMALLWLAKQPGTRPGIYYAYREKHGGVSSTREHVRLTRRASLGERITGVFGGAKAEKQQRLDWQAGGLRVDEPPIHDVESGIDAVTAWLRENRLYVFDHLTGLRDEFGTYARELDDSGEPTDKIKDKEHFHHLDALRYVVAGLSAPRARTMIVQAITRHGWGL